MKPKVFMLIDATQINGPGKGLFQLLQNAPVDAFDYVLCNFSYSTKEKNAFQHAAEARGFNTHTLRQHNRFDPSPLWQAARVIKDKKCNLIQTHSYKGHFIACILSKITGIPWLAFAHGWTAEDWKVKLYHKLDLWLLKYAHSTVAVSPVLKKTLDRSRSNGSSTQLILNAVDQNELSGTGSSNAIRKRCGCSINPFIIGCFGRLSKEKGQEFLLRAFSQLNAETSGLSLLFVGDGPERKRLEHLAQKMNLSEQVFFEGYRANMLDYYKAIDLLVLPSLSEGLPNVILEAMSLSVPVVATKVGAVPDVLENGKTGWLVSPGNYLQLYGKIKFLLGNRALLSYVSSEAKSSLYPRFCPVNRSLQISTLYCSLLENLNKTFCNGVSNATRQ